MALLHISPTPGSVDAGPVLTAAYALDDERLHLVEGNDHASVLRDLALPEGFAFHQLLNVDPSDPDALAAFSTTWALPLLPMTCLLSGPAELDDGSTLQRCSVAAAGCSLRFLQALARHWLEVAQAVGAGRAAEPERAWIMSGLMAEPSSVELAMGGATNKAWNRWANVMNQLLEAFSPRVSVRLVYDSDQPLIGDAYRLFGMQPSYLLAEVVALQVYDAITNNRPVKRCASQTCDRLFLFQVGMSNTPGRHRSDAIYCTNSCAKAEANRQLRRRKRAEAEASRRALHVP